MDKKYIKVGSYQGPSIEKEPYKALKKIQQILNQEKSNGLDILCLPECFLHGYFNSSSEARKYSINLNENFFQEVLSITKGYQTTIILGINEVDDSNIYNTAVILEDGRLLGKYRKAYTYEPYDYYKCGRDFPVFYKQGIPFGIIICYDSVFIEPARITALNGARILFCPMFNRVKRDSRMLYYLNLKSHFVARAFENDCWFISSDITYDSKTETCPGYTGIFNRLGQQVGSTLPYEEGIISYNIPITDLKDVKNKLIGNEELNDIMNDAYKKRVLLRLMT